MKAHLALALSAALAMSGCQSTLTTANNNLAAISNNQIAVACPIIKVAEGYFANVKSKVSALAVTREAQAAAVVDTICANPPTDVATAFTDLFNAWIAIQNATTVP